MLEGFKSLCTTWNNKDTIIIERGDTSINPKNFTTIPYHFTSTLLNAYFDFEVNVAIDVAKCALDLMQG